MREQLEAAEAHRAAGVRADVPPVPPWIQVTESACSAAQGELRLLLPAVTVGRACTPYSSAHVHTA